jgi:uncharacterized protein
LCGLRRAYAARFTSTCLPDPNIAGSIPTRTKGLASASKQANRELRMMWSKAMRFLKKRRLRKREERNKTDTICIRRATEQDIDALMGLKAPVEILHLHLVFPTRDCSALIGAFHLVALRDRTSIDAGPT